MGANGQAVYTTTSIGPGTHFITASYGGDPTFLPSSANAITVTIDELRILRVGNNNTTILPGTTVVYTLQVMPQVVDTFLYNVSFAASGLPAGATATFSPVTLPAGGKTTNITMTVETAGTCLEHATNVTLRASVARPRAFASPVGDESNAQASATDSPISGSGVACSAQPGRGRGPERVLGCGPFRGAKSSLLDHGHRYRRNSSALNPGATCDSVGRVWEKVCIDLQPYCLWERCWESTRPASTARSRQEEEIFPCRVPRSRSPTVRRKQTPGPALRLLFHQRRQRRRKLSHLSRLYHGGRCNLRARRQYS